MGKRGPPRTPTAHLEASGSSRAKERKRTEPRPPPGVLQPPRDLSAPARAVFRQLARDLQTMGVATKIDAISLGRYVRLLMRWRADERLVAEQGSIVIVMSREGNARPTINPAAIEANMLAAQLLRLEDRFGLSPAARASLAVNPEKNREPEGDEYFDDASSA